jgi:hypothetical protein
MDDLSTRKMNAITLLATTQDMVSESIRVSTLLNNSEELNAELKQSLTQIKGKIVDSKDAIETYEQEFMERKKSLSPTQPALKTLQDYVLAFFFFSFLLVSIFISLYVGSSLKNVGSGVITFLVMCAIGVMISQVLLRFA